MSNTHLEYALKIIFGWDSQIEAVKTRLPKGATIMLYKDRYGRKIGPRRGKIVCKGKGRTGAALRRLVANKEVTVSSRNRKSRFYGGW